MVDTCNCYGDNPPLKIIYGSFARCGDCQKPLSVAQADALVESSKKRKELLEASGGGMLSAVGSKTSWSKGKRIVQLPTNHPDHWVESQKDSERIYQKHNISMETGDFKDEKSRNRAIFQGKALNAKKKRKKLRKKP